jgi:hypothetical protein
VRFVLCCILKNRGWSGTPDGQALEAIDSGDHAVVWVAGQRFGGDGAAGTGSRSIPTRSSPVCRTPEAEEMAATSPPSSPSRNHLRALGVGGVPTEDETGTVWRPWELLTCCLASQKTAGDLGAGQTVLLPVAHARTRWMCGSTAAGVLARFRLVDQGSPLIGERNSLRSSLHSWP